MGEKDVFGNVYKELDLEEEGVSDVSELHYSNVFGSYAEGGNTAAIAAMMQALSLHGPQAQHTGLQGIEYEAGLKGISMDQMLGDLWDMTHTEAERAAQGTTSTDRATFIMDYERQLAEQHGMSLGMYQLGHQELIQESMGSAYGSQPFGYNEPAQAQSMQGTAGSPSPEMREDMIIERLQGIWEDYVNGDIDKDEYLEKIQEVGDAVDPASGGKGHDETVWHSHEGPLYEDGGQAAASQLENWDKDASAVDEGAFRYDGSDFDH